MSQTIVTDPWPRCPDGGRCWHRCGSACFRVLGCAPLTEASSDGVWPEELKRAAEKAAARDDTEVLDDAKVLDPQDWCTAQSGPHDFVMVTDEPDEHDGLRCRYCGDEPDS